MYRKTSISDYYRAVQKELERVIQTGDSKYILDTPTNQIVSDLLKSGHGLSPITFDSSKKETMRHRKEMRTVPAHQRDHFYRGEGDKRFEYEILDITIPITSNPTISKIKDLEPSTHSMSWSSEDFNWGQENVSFSFEIKGYGFKHEDQLVINEVAQRKNHIHEWAGWVNKDIAQSSEMLEKNLPSFINDRKKKLKDDEGRMGDLSSKLGISLE